MRHPGFVVSSPSLRTVLRVGVTFAVLGAAALSFQAWVSSSHSGRSAGFAAAVALAPLGILLLLVVAIVGLAVALRPKRTMQQALVVVASSDTLMALSTSRPGMALAGAIGLSLLVTARSLWSELSDIRASRLGRLVLVGAGALLAGLFLIERPKGALLVLVVLLLVIALTAAFWALLLLVRNAPLPSDGGPLQTVYQAHAAAGVSPFALMQDKRYFWNQQATAFLAYATRAGAAVVLGPGIGPSESLPALYRAFRDECHRRGWRLSFYQVPSAMADSLSWGVRYRLGDEAIVNLEELTLEGPRMAKLRHEVSRGRRNGVTTRMVPAAELSEVERTDMRELTAGCAEHRAFGEMAFSVSRGIDPPRAPTTVGLARDCEGRLVAYATWLSLPAARGVALDAMRRRPGAPGGAMDLLLYSCMQQFKDRASWASLGLAPAAGPAAASLHAFKGKFQPRWEPRFMVAERLIDWPLAGFAALLVHYPTLKERWPKLLPSPVQWLRAAA